jgi:hypothetical protein
MTTLHGGTPKKIYQITLNPIRFWKIQALNYGYSLSCELRSTPFSRFLFNSLRLFGLPVHRPQSHRLGAGRESGLLLSFPRFIVSFHCAYAFGFACRLTPDHGGFGTWHLQH